MPSAPRILICLTLAFAAGAQEPAPPTPIDGELDRISAKVTRVLDHEDTRMLLLVEVRNRSDASFEPLVFRLGSGRGEDPWPVAIERAPWPKAARIGRPVPPRGKEEYVVLVADQRLPKRPNVEVVDGSFWTPETVGSQLPNCPIDVGPLRHETTRGEQGTMPRTLVPLRNTSQRPVDVILRGRASAPLDGEFLWTASLAPGQARDVSIEHLPWTLSWELEPAGNGARIDAVEAIDWTWRMPRDATGAASRLLDAYRSWHRWDGRVSAEGEFTILDVSTRDGTARGAGRFVMAPDGDVKIELKSGDDRRLGTERKIESAFADLFRASPDVVAATNAFDDMGDGWVATRGERWDDDQTHASRSSADPDAQWPIWKVADGRIVASGYSTTDPKKTWETVALGQGWVCTDRRAKNALPHETWEWTLVDGVAVPRRFQQTWAQDDKGKLTFGSVLEFRNVTVRRDGPDRADEALPGGPGATALRAIWDASHRYPEQPVTLRCSFRIETPGTDGVWAGHRLVVGSMTIEGFRGFVHHGRMWEAIAIDLDRSMPSGDAPALRSAIQDRLGMWAGRDLAGRPPFDAAFAGGTIAAPKAGRFTIDGSIYRAIAADDGRVAEIEMSAGTRRRTTYRRLDDAYVPARVVTDDETLSAEWERVDGYLLPVRFRFERVFGADWGPEVIELSDVRIER